MLTHPERGVIGDPAEIEAVGHRVVHGGEKFTQSALATPEAIRAVEECISLAPLHNPPNLRGYEAARRLLPDVPHALVFDTAYHQTMPPHAYLYGLPYVLYTRHGIRRYGFHGTSHRFVGWRSQALLGRPRSETRLVTCHLGNGASVCAIDHGRSVDTSMGFTPLEGLLMGTRTGDLDPAVVFHVMHQEDLTEHQVTTLLNKHSGLYGISGVSNDMRELLAEEAKGHERAQLAIEMFCYRLRKYIAAYAGAMGGVDAVLFTGGIGENAPSIRARSLAGLEFMGIHLDPARNDAAVRRARLGSRPTTSPVAGAGRAHQRGADHRARHRAAGRRAHRRFDTPLAVRGLQAPGTPSGDPGALRPSGTCAFGGIVRAATRPQDAWVAGPHPGGGSKRSTG